MKTSIIKFRKDVDVRAFDRDTMRRPRPAGHLARAPRGYRVQPWADGTWHVYRKEGTLLNCIAEEPSQQAGIARAYQDRRERRDKEWAEITALMRADLASREETK